MTCRKSFRKIEIVNAITGIKQSYPPFVLPFITMEKNVLMRFSSQLTHKLHLMGVSLHLSKVNIHHSHNSLHVNLSLKTSVMGIKN